MMSLLLGHWQRVQDVLRGTLTASAFLLALILILEIELPKNGAPDGNADAWTAGLSVAAAIGVGVVGGGTRKLPGVFGWALVGVLTVVPIGMWLSHDDGIPTQRGTAWMVLFVGFISLGVASSWLANQDPRTFCSSTRMGIGRVLLAGIGIYGTAAFVLGGLELLVGSASKGTIGVDGSDLSILLVVLGTGAVALVAIPSAMILHAEFTKPAKGLWSADLLTTLVVVLAISATGAVSITSSSVVILLLTSLALLITVVASAVWERLIRDGTLTRGPGFIVLAFAFGCLSLGFLRLGDFFGEPNTTDFWAFLVCFGVALGMIVWWWRTVSGRSPSSGVGQ